MKTREEERQERRTSRAVWIVSTMIIAVWVAALVLSCKVRAAYDVESAETAKNWLAGIGGFAGALALTKAAVWLDTPRRK